MAAASFVWDDPFLLEDQLQEDERMIRDSAKAFAEAELLPRVQDAYLEEKTDPGLFKLMGQAGLLGVTLPEEFGAACVFLCSRHAGFIVGQNLLLDGGGTNLTM